MTIRPARPGDEPALYAVCLRTGADGDDATDRHRDPRLLGEVYVGPYLVLEPALAFVVADDAGAVGFYRRMGFTELGGDDAGLTMGRRLPA